MLPKVQICGDDHDGAMKEYSSDEDIQPSANEKEASSESGDQQDSISNDSQSSTSIDVDDFLGPAVSSSPSFTFKIVGDNIDKEVKPRDMRSDYQAHSLHYFHSYAVHDRVNMDRFDDTVCAPDMSAVSLELLLPSKQDIADIFCNMSILIARILKKYMPFFKQFGNGVERHIMHQYSEEMSRKSSVVSAAICIVLGLIDV